MQPVFVPDYAAFEHVTDDHIRDTVIGEGVSSSLSVPLAFKGQLLGVLHVANRSPTEYSEWQASLLWALAHQAAVAIINAQLYASLDERNAMLEQAFSIHRELTRAGLSGVGLDGVGEAVVNLLDRPLVLEQEITSPFRRTWAPPGAEVDEHEPGLELPLLGGAEEIGTLRVQGTFELAPIDRMALEQAGIVVALELAKLRTARDVESRLRGEILEELLEREGAVPARIADRAALLGLDLSKPHRVLVVRPDAAHEDEGANLLTTVRSTVAGMNLSPSLSGRRGPSVVLALREHGDVAHTVADAILAAGARAGAPCSIGIGSAQASLALSYREARACLRLAQAVGTGARSLRFEQVGSLRFLLDAPDSQHAVGLVIEELGRFIRHDDVARTPLLPTLRAYVEADGHHPTVAARCFIHVSTLKYRIGRINGLLDEPLSSSETRFRLRLAFRVWDLLTALGVDVDVPDEA
jgi:sugar diacid utilization regulator